MEEYGPVGSNYVPLARDWHRLSHGQPSLRRSLHGLIGYRRDSTPVFVILGGWDPSIGRCNDVWESIDLGASWHCVCASAPWSARSSFLALGATDGSCLFVIGGDDGDYRSDVWFSKDFGKSWLCVSEKAGWQGRSDLSGVMTQSGGLLIFGGRTVGEGDGFLGDIWRSLDGGLTWEVLLEVAPFNARVGAGMGIGYFGGFLTRKLRNRKRPRHRSPSPSHPPPGLKEVVVLVGGSAGRKFFGDVWISRNLGESWTKGHPLPSSSPSSDDERPLPSGFGSAADLNDLEISSFTLNEEVGPFTLFARHKHVDLEISSPSVSAFAVSGAQILYDEISREFILLGGCVEQGRGNREVFGSRDGGRTWKFLPQLPSLSVNVRVAVAYGNLLIFGGENVWGPAVSESWLSKGQLEPVKKDAFRVLLFLKRLKLSMEICSRLLAFIYSVDFIWPNESGRFSSIKN